ncbi:MAG: gamma-glutamyltransferase [Acetobacterales bacterium]
MTGMVVAPQPDAVEAGALVLRAGGNAVDAAVTTALVQGVVDPMMCGITGFGCMHYYMPERKAHGLIEFYGRAPAAATPDMWADLLEGESPDGFGFALKGRVNALGHAAVAVPGSLKAYAEAHERFGRLPWREVVQPAVEQAKEGFVVRPSAYQFWLRDDSASGKVNKIDKLRHSATGRRVYFDADGNLLTPGKMVRNPDMARTLERIRDGGAREMYEGEIAREIAADMKANGGLIDYDDLKNYRTTGRDLLWGSYRGLRIATCPPPGGGLKLVELLNVMERFDLAGMGHNSVEHMRVVAEAMKYATIDKDRHMGDPAFVEVPVERLSSKDYAAELAERIRRGEKADVARVPLSKEPRDTTHLCVADGDGNMVTLTHTLGSASGAITDGLGYMYNDAMAAFDPRPGHAGSIAPGKGRFTAMAPSILFDGEKPLMAIGAPGGAHIVTALAQAISNVVDFGMTMTEAVSAPRFSATGNAIQVSYRIPRFVTRELEAMGYPVKRSHEGFAFAAVHAILMKDGVLSGGADPGREGIAIAV